MQKKKRVKVKTGRVLIIILVIVLAIGLFYYKTRSKLQVISVVSEISDYNYQLDSNSIRLYKKYYKELVNELKDNKVDEKKYAELISKLFVIDYYTLNNKVTNKNIGGVQFIHSELKNSFITDASNTIYKYVESNLYGTRKQKLPEVNNVEIKAIKELKYDNKYKDNSSYEVVVEVGYVKNYNYPKLVTLNIIHEDNKLAIVEIK